VSTEIQPTTRLELRTLVEEFNWKLDHAEPEGFAELFTPDGLFVAGPKEHVGHEALAAFAAARTAQPKLSRTMVCNHRLIAADDDHISGAVQYILFMADEDAPQSTEIFAVGEYSDEYTRTGDGWRIAKRTSRQVFQRAS
jgi:uncharacterized protein (TIGR02246 family)